MKKDWSRIVFLVGVVLMFAVSSIVIIKTFEKKAIQEKNIEVIAKVIEAPISCKDLGRRPPYSKIEYNNQLFIKKTGNQFCHLVSKREFVVMLTNEKGDELLFPNEYDPIQFVYGVALLLIAISISIKKF